MSSEPGAFTVAIGGGPRSGRSHMLYAIVVAIAIAIGVALRWPLFEAGLCSDDYFQYAMVEGIFPLERSFLELCKYSDGSPKEVKVLQDFGTLPRWSHPKLRLTMMRPLSGALIALDHALFGLNLVAHHLHSVLWWAFLVICVAIVLRVLLPAHIAATAVLLFVIEESNGLPMAWVSNRNTLIALSLGLLGLLAHIHWRRAGHRGARVLSIFLFAVALLSGEWAFTLLAYLFAFELMGVGGSVRTRLAALLPAAMLCAAFVLAQNALDYGVFASSSYINPFIEPGVFLLEASRRIPVYFAELVFGVETSLWNMEAPFRSFFVNLGVIPVSVLRQMPGWRFWHVLLGIAAGAVGLLVVRWGLRDCEDSVRRELGWLLLGSLLALVPMVAALASSRSVLPSFIGASAACSVVLWHGCQRLYSSIKRNPFRPSVVPLLVVLGVIYCQGWRAVRRSAVETDGHVDMCQSVREWVLQADIDENEVAGKRVVLLNGYDHTVAFYSPFIRHSHGLAMPRSWWTLSAALHPYDIVRTSANELELVVLGGTLLGGEVEQFFRASRFPFRVGDTVSLHGLRVEILRLLDGKPLRVRFTFDKPLDDPSYLFLHNTPTGLRRFDLPPVGGRVRLPIAAFLDWRLLQQ